MFYLNICQIDKHDLMYNNSNNLQILREILMKLNTILINLLESPILIPQFEQRID